MTGLARRLAKGPVKHPEQLQKQYDLLLIDKGYRAAVETGTSQEANVDSRLTLATGAFDSVQ